MTAISISHPWWRFLRFSVCGLMVSALVVGAGMGWLVRSARIQREAVAAIESAQGCVTYDWEYSNGKAILRGKPWAPQWLTDLIGVDYFGHVTVVGLMPIEIDAVMVQVGHLTRLQRLSVLPSSLSDAELVHLKGLTNLSELDLYGSPVSDAGLAHLKGLSKLSSLALGGTRISDAGLVHLKALTSLSVLRLSSTQVTDAGLVHLGGLNSLQFLKLEHTRVSDAGLFHLKALTNLSSLYLDGTQVTDSGIKDLRQALPGLTIYD